MIALDQLKDLIAQAPVEGKKQPQPGVAKLEPAFAKTLAGAFKPDDDAPAPPAPQHAVNIDVAHRLMVSAAMQMVLSHAAVQAVNVASAASLSVSAPAAKAPALATADPGAIKVPTDGASAALDPADERLLAAFAKAHVDQSPEAPPKTSEAAQPAPKVHATELVQLVARNVSPNQPRVEMILQSPELGKVHLNVEVRNSDIHVRISADNHEVAKVLSDKMPQLEAALREQGLKVGSVSIAEQSAEAGMSAHTGEERGQGSYDERPEAIESHEQSPPKRQDQRTSPPPKAVARGLDVLA